MHFPIRVCKSFFSSAMPRLHSTASREDLKNLPPSQALFRLSRFSPEYRGRLIKGISDLQLFCRKETGLRLAAILKQPRAADEVFGRYVISRHQSAPKSALSTVKHALLGVQHVCPGLRKHLTTPWENLRVWEEQKSTKLRPPLPVPLWVFMIGLARGHARVSNQPLRREWELLAVLLEIGLLCMLRPGELFKLLWSDLALPGEFSLSQAQAALRVVSPKNRRQFGDEQFVSLSNQNTIEWLRSLKPSNHDLPIWGSSPSRFGKLFRQLSQELYIEKCRFTPASLRPGGATMFFGKGISIPVLRFMGRWTVERSLEHYIQQAMATQILNRLDDPTKKRLKQLGALCIDLVLHARCQNAIPCVPSSQRMNGSALVKWCGLYAELTC